MPTYHVTFARSATKELGAIAEPFQSNILEKVEQLAVEPKPSGCKKLKGSKSLWRVRVGKYRVVYSVDHRAHVVDIIAIGHRQSIYG